MLILVILLVAFNVISVEKVEYHSAVEIKLSRLEEAQLLIEDMPNGTNYGRIDLRYMKPQHCRDRQLHARVVDSPNLCWLECSEGNKELCKTGMITTVELEGLSDTIESVYCAPRVIIVGMPRCGTKDLHQWLVKWF